MFNLLEKAEYERLWQELVRNQPEEALGYFQYHKNRYYELLDSMAYYLQDKRSATVLEVGVSGFLPLYKQKFPHITLITIDRPVEINGADASFCMPIGKAERHYNIDLNQQALCKDSGSPPLGTFDYVICTEVIEHLVVNPVQLISELLGLLNEDGYLYLTTPNFFSFHRLLKITQGENPLPLFPRRGENKDCGHHFREYAMNELLGFTKKAGGHIVAAYYSDCWDDETLKREVLSKYPELSANLVLVATSQKPNRVTDTSDLNSKKYLNTQSTASPITKIITELIDWPDSEPARLQEVELSQLLTERKREIARLQTLVEAYERGRFIRAMQALNQLWLKIKNRGRGNPLRLPK